MKVFVILLSSNSQVCWPKTLKCSEFTDSRKKPIVFADADKPQ